MRRGQIAVLRFKLLMGTYLLAWLITLTISGGSAFKRWYDQRHALPPRPVSLCVTGIQDGWRVSQCVEPDGTVVVSRLYLPDLGSPATYEGHPPATRVPTVRR